MSKPIIETYKSLGDNEYAVSKFASAFAVGEITLAELYVIQRPKRQGQALALFGGYAVANFGMGYEAVSDYASVFTAKAQDVYELMSGVNDLASLIKGLNALESEISNEADARVAVRNASGETHESAIKSVARQITTLHSAGTLNKANQAKLEDVIAQLSSILNESKANTQELISK